MINRDSQKAALLLTMIIGTQLWGSKEKIAGAAGDRSEITVNKKVEFETKAVKTSILVDELKKVEGGLECRIFRTMGKLFKDLTNEQIKRVIIEEYAPKLKPIKGANELHEKLLDLIDQNDKGYDDRTNGQTGEGEKKSDVLDNQFGK